MTVAAQWVRRNWRSGHLDLMQDGLVVASFEGRGSRGVARVDGVIYSVQRLRLPPYVTLRDAETDELIARFALSAEFLDGDSFRYGWVRFWAREWNWVDERGEPVLWSRRRWSWTAPIEFESSSNRKWRLLAVLELASRELSIPFLTSS